MKAGTDRNLWPVSQRCCSRSQNFPFFLQSITCIKIFYSSKLQLNIVCILRNQVWMKYIKITEIQICYLGYKRLWTGPRVILTFCWLTNWLIFFCCLPTIGERWSYHSTSSKSYCYQVLFFFLLINLLKIGMQH